MNISNVSPLEKGENSTMNTAKHQKRLGFDNASTDAKCPHCGSLLWIKIHRSWFQRLTHPQQRLCYCRECNQEFWKQN